MSNFHENPPPKKNISEFRCFKCGIRCADTTSLSDHQRFCEAPPRTYQYHPRSRNIHNKTRLKVKLKYNYRCAICNRTEEEAGTLHHIDHIIPFSKGGSNDFNNLQLLCEECNFKKRCSTEEQKIMLQKQRRISTG